MTHRYLCSTVLASILVGFSPVQKEFVASESGIVEMSALPRGVISGIFVVDAKKTQLQWKGSNLFNFNEHSGKVNVSKGDLTVEKNILVRFS